MLFFLFFSGDYVAIQLPLEKKGLPSTSYLEHQEVTSDMRRILIDWLVELTTCFSMEGSVLHMATSLVDRFLSAAELPKEEMQLLGVTCIFIASKFDDANHPSVESFADMADGACTAMEVIDMEVDVLCTLEYELAVPTVATFLPSFLTIREADRDTSLFATFIAELTLLEYDFLQFPPSVIAAAACYIANISVRGLHWTPAMTQLTSYQPADLWPCIRKIHKFYVKSAWLPLQGICDRYHLVVGIPCLIPLHPAF